MAVTAEIVLTQFGGQEGDFTPLALPGLSDCDLTFYDVDMSSECNYLHIPIKAVVNPVPSAGNVKNHAPYYTENADDWVDGPVLSPSLSNRLRFGYGRYGVSRYGNNDRYAGTMISTVDPAVYGEYVGQDIEFNNSMCIQDRNVSDISSDFLMEETEQVTGDVTVYQYDFIMSASPVPFSYRNPVDSDVSIRLSNYIYPLSSGTVTLFLDDAREEPLEVVPFYVGLGGFDATWYNDREFGYDTQVNVEWRVFDTVSPTPNEIVINYWFRTVTDTIGPRVVDMSPEDNEVDVSVDTCVLFTLRDYETGVNVDTLELYVNNRLVPLSDLTITVASTEDGYVFRYCPETPFMYGDEIPVSIYVEDLADMPNEVFHVYSFTTEHSNPPVVLGSEPMPCRKYKPITTDVEVDIVDGGHGLDEDTIVFGVDDDVVQYRKLPIIYREDD